MAKQTIAQQVEAQVAIKLASHAALVAAQTQSSAVSKLELATKVNKLFWQRWEQSGVLPTGAESATGKIFTTDEAIQIFSTICHKSPALGNAIFGKRESHTASWISHICKSELTKEFQSPREAGRSPLE